MLEACGPITVEGIYFSILSLQLPIELKIVFSSNIYTSHRNLQTTVLFFPSQFANIGAILMELLRLFDIMCSHYEANCALDRRTILSLYVPGFQRQVFKHVKILSERSKEMKEQRERPCCGMHSLAS